MRKARDHRAVTDLERELLCDLYEGENLFVEGKLQADTLASHVEYRMAARRGHTLPAPVYGKVQTDHVFRGVVARAIRRLVAKGLVRPRVLARRVQGAPSQWGFAHHARRMRDVALTEAGRALAEESVRKAPTHMTVAYVHPKSPQRPPAPQAETTSVQAGNVRVTYVYKR